MGWDQTPPAFNPANYSVDFEISLGKHDPYMQKYYEHFFNGYKKSNTHFDYLKPFSGQDLLELCQKTYNDYKPSVVSSSEDFRIPPIFHQIWVGNKPFPESIKPGRKHGNPYQAGVINYGQMQMLKGLNYLIKISIIRKKTSGRELIFYE